MRFLLCTKCERVHKSSLWHVDKFKHGVCPCCGCSAYRNAVEWKDIYEVNGYDEVPTEGLKYTLNPAWDL